MEQFKKSFLWNTLGTSLNAFNSLFFMIAVTRINGVDNAGIFTIAFSTACIIYIIGLYSGRIYQVTEPNKKITNKDYIANKVITTLSMIVIVILFCIIKGYTLFKTVIFILLTSYKAMEAFADVFYGILQKNDELDKVGKSLFFKSIISIILFVLIDILTKNMIISISVMLIINILILLFYDIRNSKKYIEKTSNINKEHVFKIFKFGFFTFAISFLGMYILNAPKYAIDNFLQDNYQTIFGIIVMPATVIGLVAQFLIHPYLNNILKLYENRDKKGLNNIILKLIIAIVIIGMISSLLAYFLGPEVLGLVYSIDLTTYRVQLLLIIVASTLYTIGVIYSSILTTIRDTFSQFIIYIILSLFALITSNILTKESEINGAVISYFAIMMLQATIYTIYAKIKINKILKDK